MCEGKTFKKKIEWEFKQSLIERIESDIITYCLEYYEKFLKQPKVLILNTSIYKNFINFIGVNDTNYFNGLQIFETSTENCWWEVY